MWMRCKLPGESRQRERFTDKVAESLALHKRNEVRADGLLLERTCNRLEIHWRARDVHPWDSDLSGKERESAFLRQVMDDTEAALLQLFERLPEIDEIDLTVLDVQTENVWLSGTVHRTSLASPFDRILSIRMRLAFLGIRFHFAADSVVNPGIDGAESALRIA
jgi:hypothetical protein